MRLLILAGLSVAALGVAPKSAESVRREHEQNLRRDYERSQQRCKHGEAGVIVVLEHESATTPEGLHAHLKRRRQDAKRQQAQKKQNRRGRGAEF